MYRGKYAERRVRGLSRSEFGDHNHHASRGDGLHPEPPDMVSYSAAETEWLCAVDAWKVRRGPVVKGAELLVILNDLGYRREGGMAAADLDTALEHERRKLALECGRRGRHLTACEVLRWLLSQGWQKSPLAGSAR